MNKQQMMALFAKRLNLSPEETDALQTGDFRRMAATRFPNDPLIMSMMDTMEQRQRDALPASDGKPVTRQRGTQVIDEEDVERLQAAVRAAKTTLHYLSDLFGACRCWGQNSICPRCNGEGVPGLRPPADANTFLAWVKPGLRALGYEIIPTSTNPTAVPHANSRAKEE